jgi:hypothetical protein
MPVKADMGIGGARELRLLIFYSRLPRLGGRNRGEQPHERKGSSDGLLFAGLSQQNKSRLCHPDHNGQPRPNKKTRRLNALLRAEPRS